MSNDREANPFKMADLAGDSGADRGTRTVTKSELADAFVNNSLKGITADEVMELFE